MSKPTSPQLVRVLVDFYQGGRLLYKKDNVYPLNERLQLLQSRGEAEAYTPPPAAKGGQTAGKRSNARAEPSAASGTQTVVDKEAASASVETISGASASEEIQQQAQGVADEVTDSKDQTAQA